MTPEQVSEIEKIVDACLTQRLGGLLGASSSRFLSDKEVCSLIGCSDRKLRDLISSGELVRGAHFTGSGKSRLWMRDRVERYLETRDNPAQQLRDIKQWKK